MPISTIDSKGLTSPLTSGVTTNTVTSAAATALTLQSAGTTAITIDTSQNVGIGNTSPSGKLDVTSSAVAGLVGAFRSTATNGGYVQFQGSGSTPTTTGYVGAASKLNTGGSVTDFGMTARTNLVFGTNDGTERMRITSSGALLVGKTTTGSNTTGFEFEGSGGALLLTRSSAINALINLQGSSGQTILFRFQNSDCGSISVNTGSTAYNTSSDYRLKNTIAPLVGALAKVAQLKPVTYKWNADNSYGEGFIAHELAEVCPLAVNGEKDAVDENGNIKPQGIDTSFLVATLTAALQETKALIDTQAETINALTARIVALETA